MHYEPATRQLDLLPVFPAHATQLRLLGRQLITRINTKTGQETVKELRVLAPGSDMGLRPVTAGRRLLLESGEVHAPAAEV
ncbi:hypothetical protein [Streptomyces sp. CoH27]|uniref:hypothetical protein n=1 Tax=Streptomyces sp. CoH27 TaxID=2875763 RepID=UPI0027E1BEB3|nr:hypothetical protein [Streptomyces sp. CoH27]